MRKPVVGVMGGANAADEVLRQAEEVGRLIARRGWVLLNGGRVTGVMEASARGAKREGGIVIGILPDKDDRQATPDLDYAIITGLGDARNLVNVLSSDVIIALRGGAGTISEVALGLKNGKRVITFGLPLGPAFEPYRELCLLSHADSLEQAVQQAADHIQTKPSERP
ncbi:MAG: hypothetical protein HJJLKODD_00005 [Phycisphaerae bacterium]|nr:hypothetical protein [Phycisphaerae bacterium]